jgi:murein DD-endopeptidase MepM/ murein hydrolase activator NlpD
MNEEKKKNKKKILTYYLILGACLLIIAAVTLTVIFTMQGNNDLPLDADTNNSQEDNNVIDNGGSQASDNTDKSQSSTPPTDNKQDSSTDDSTNVSTKYQFITPLDSVELVNSYTFYKNKTLDYYHFHTGLDFAADEGTPIFACADGTIESITTGDLLDGTVITISHEGGIKTVYKFVDAAENLAVGDSVQRGQTIGTIAAANGSEYKDGTHLHFEVYSSGVLTDPEDLLDIASK